MLSSACAAQAGINVWTGSRHPEFDQFTFAPGTPSTAYASIGTADQGWVYKSTDGGSTWDQIFMGDPVALVAAYPSTPNSLYLITLPSDENAPGAHVLRSTDGGVTWFEAATGLQRGSNTVFRVGALAIDPFAPSTLYAGTELGVFKSIDAASTWSALNTGLPNDNNNDSFVYQLVIDPITSTTLYAGYIDYTTRINGLPETGLLKSTDGGSTWNAADSGLPTVLFPVLAIDPRTPNTLYVGANVVMFGGEYSTSPAVFKSTDGGGTWNSDSDTGLPADADVDALVVDPHTSATLYVAVSPGGVFQSDDGGINWRPLSTGQTFVGARELAVDPLGPTTIYAFTDDGVFSIQQAAAVCAGDCSGVATVAINDLVTLVNIALGTAPPSACAGGGLPLGGGVDVAVIMEAVNNALSGCRK